MKLNINIDPIDVDMEDSGSFEISIDDFIQDSVRRQVNKVLDDQIQKTIADKLDDIVKDKVKELTDTYLDKVIIKQKGFDSEEISVRGYIQQNFFEAHNTKVNKNSGRVTTDNYDSETLIEHMLRKKIQEETTAKLDDIAKKVQGELVKSTRQTLEEHISSEVVKKYALDEVVKRITRW